MAQLGYSAGNRGGIDLSEIRFRMQSIEAGVKLTLVTCAAGWIYVIATWDLANRRLIASLFGVAAVVALVFVLFPHEHVIRSRWRELFFLAWSVANIMLAAAVTSADGGSTSPLALLFFLPLIYAALSYPLLSVVFVGAFDYLAYVVVAVTGDRPTPEYVGFFALCLAVSAVVCAWHARHQDRRRQDLARISRTDPLTGCLNRRGFEERFDEELRRASRAGRPLGLITLDLDNFKRINDSSGHAAGDEVLRWAVEKMETVVRAGDAVGRLGGDEFAVLAPEAGPRDTAALVARLKEALAERAPASVGMACFPTDGTDRDELQRCADDALYTRKRGRLLGVETLGRELSWATALADAVDKRVAIQHAHSQQVAEYCIAIADHLGWPVEEMELLRIAAILHDVGKVTVPDSILRKKEPLVDADWEEIRKHPAAGADLVARIEGLNPIVPWIRHSQEHFDGSGYPDGLKGEEIPFASRILYVADAFDSMTSGRPYRRAVARKQALDELERNAGTQFDPVCVAALVRELGPVVEAA